MSFKTEFKRVQKQMYRISANHGFHNIDEQIDRLNEDYAVPYDLVQSIREARVAQGLMLVVSELSEALEATRHGNPPDSHIPAFSGVEAELADAIIRIQDLAETGKHRLADAIVAKASYNSRRPAMHGDKKF